MSSSPRLLVSIPTEPNGEVSVHLVAWFFHIQRELADWFVQFEILQGKPVASTRNEQFRKFLQRDDVDYLLTVDDDAVPDIEGLKLLMEAIQKPEIDAVGGWSVMISDDEPIPCVQRYWSDKPASPAFDLLYESDPGLYELTGTGGIGAHCLMVKKSTVQKFFDEKVVWFKDQIRDGSLEHHHIVDLVEKYRPDKDLPPETQIARLFKLHHELEIWQDRRKDFDLEHVGGRYTGQDVWFCKRCTDLRLRLWVDTRVFWGHIKPSDIRRLWLEMYHYKAQMQQMREKLHAAQEGKGPKDDQPEHQGNGEVRTSPKAGGGRGIAHGAEVEGAGTA